MLDSTEGIRHVTDFFAIEIYYAGVAHSDLRGANNGMKPGAIISRRESLQILMNDLRKAAMEKQSARLNEASPEEREAIVAEIDREVRKEIRRRRWKRSIIPWT